ncbi:MAG: hypothetical protein EOP50_21010 [Sphingobacteriales bacterium]|nr:MAG: hypothetical protein EOP50_21010 [Sphingobacteriales bacterium]
MSDTFRHEIFQTVRVGASWQVVDKRSGHAVQCDPLDEFEAVELAALLSSMVMDMAPGKPTIH